MINAKEAALSSSVYTEKMMKQAEDTIDQQIKKAVSFGAFATDVCFSRQYESLRDGIIQETEKAGYRVRCSKDRDNDFCLHISWGA